MSVVFLCPGQGSQKPNMLNELPDNKIINQTIEEASDILQVNVLHLDQEKALNSTYSVQIALFIWGIAMGELLKKRGAKPHFTAGHSVGAFTSSVLSNALPFSEALTLVTKRGELMESEFSSGFGMGAVNGMTERRMQSIISSLSLQDSVFISNINSNTQITVSGTIQNVQKALEALSKAGASSAKMLNVKVPSHSPLMERIAEQMRLELEEAPVQRASIPYAANVSARAVTDPEKIRKDLSESIKKPVRWHDAMCMYYERGARLFIELSPRSVLSNIINQTFADARGLSIQTQGADNCLELIKRYN